MLAEIWTWETEFEFEIEGCDWLALDLRPGPITDLVRLRSQ